MVPSPAEGLLLRERPQAVAPFKHPQHCAGSCHWLVMPERGACERQNVTEALWLSQEAQERWASVANQETWI